MTEQPRRRRQSETELTPRSLSEQIEKSSNAEPQKAEPIVGPDPSTITIDRLIPSGVTLLNCACSDNPFGAFALGSINTIPGKSASGKTELMLTMLAMCAIDKRFDDYLLIDDDAEHSNSFNLEYLFPPLVERLKSPQYDKDKPVYSETIEDFKGSILTKCKGKKPFIYVLDSLDSLSSTAEVEREFANAIKKAKSEKAIKEIKKSYGTEVSRVISQTLRMIDSMIKKSDSTLFIVQQTRQNMNRVNKFSPDWITAGGESPFFYSFHRVFLRGGEGVKATSKNITHQIGGHTRCQIIKNKLNGKRRKSGVEFDIYEDLGIDDVASCVDFLKTTGVWSSDSGGTTAHGIFNEKMSRDELIQRIEKEGAIYEMQQLVGKVWNEIEDDIRLKNRARRF